MYTNEDLEKMSKAQLILVVTDLQNKIFEEKDKTKSKAGVVLVGSREYVRKYVEKEKNVLERGDK